MLSQARYTYRRTVHDKQILVPQQWAWLLLGRQEVRLRWSLGSRLASYVGVNGFKRCWKRAWYFLAEKDQVFIVDGASFDTFKL